MIKQIDHLAIVVTDLERSRKFFEVLGFQETIRSALDAAFLESVTGIKEAAGSFVGMKHQTSQLVIELLQFSSPKPVPDPDCSYPNRIGFRHLAFSVEDIEKAAARLKEFGVEFLSPIRTWEKTGKRLVYFHGPDGILMELAQYPEEKKIACSFLIEIAGHTCILYSLYSHFFQNQYCISIKKQAGIQPAYDFCTGRPPGSLR